MTAAPDDPCRRRSHRRLSSIWKELSLDIGRLAQASPALGANEKISAFKRASFLMMPQTICVLIYRISHHLHTRGWTRLARCFASLNSFLHKASISPASCIAGGFFMPHPIGVVFHGRAGANLTLYTCSLCATVHASPWGPVEDGPTLGDHVTVGAHAGVHGPVTVGDHTTIGFRVDLLGDAPPASNVVSRIMRSVTKPRPNDASPT